MMSLAVARHKKHLNYFFPTKVQVRKLHRQASDVLDFFKRPDRNQIKTGFLKFGKTLSHPKTPLIPWVGREGHVLLCCNWALGTWASKQSERPSQRFAVTTGPPGSGKSRMQEELWPSVVKLDQDMRRPKFWDSVAGSTLFLVNGTQPKRHSSLTKEQDLIVRVATVYNMGLVTPIEQESYYQILADYFTAFRPSITLADLLSEILDRLKKEDMITMIGIDDAIPANEAEIDVAQLLESFRSTESLPSTTLFHVSTAQRSQVINFLYNSDPSPIKFYPVPLSHIDLEKLGFPDAAWVAKVSSGHPQTISDLYQAIADQERDRHEAAKFLVGSQVAKFEKLLGASERQFKEDLENLLCTCLFGVPIGNLDPNVYLSTGLLYNDPFSNRCFASWLLVMVWERIAQHVIFPDHLLADVFASCDDDEAWLRASTKMFELRFRFWSLLPWHFRHLESLFCSWSSESHNPPIYQNAPFDCELASFDSGTWSSESKVLSEKLNSISVIQNIPHLYYAVHAKQLSKTFLLTFESPENKDLSIHNIGPEFVHVQLSRGPARTAPEATENVWRIAYHEPVHAFGGIIGNIRREP